MKVTSIFQIELTEDEYQALYLLLGRMSGNDRKQLGLDDEQSKLISGIFHGMPSYTPQD